MFFRADSFTGQLIALFDRIIHFDTTCYSRVESEGRACTSGNGDCLLLLLDNVSSLYGA